MNDSNTEFNEFTVKKGSCNGGTKFSVNKIFFIGAFFTENYVSQPYL